MTPRRPKKKLWRFSAGSRGHTVEVCEREPGGVLQLRMWNPATKRQDRQSLGHRDKDRAIEQAREAAETLRRGAQPTGVVTVGRVLELYLAHRTPEKRATKSQREDRRRAAMWSRVLGAELPVADLTLAHWQSFRRQRETGAIDEHGAPVSPAERTPVGPQTIAHDGAFLRAVFYWAMRWPIPHSRGGGFLLTKNPLGAPAPGVKSAFQLPKNPTPRRPIAADDRFEAVLAAAPKVLMRVSRTDPEGVLTLSGEKRHGRGRVLSPVRLRKKPSYLAELLVLAWETGRRRAALLDLRHDDLVRRAGHVVAVRWRPTKHAEAAQVVPVSRRAQATLEAIVARRPGVGPAPLFPAPKHSDRPLSPKVADEWLREGERLAGVAHVAGGLWHPYRRAWATKRKHLPDKDVAAAGGWKTVKVLKDVYQAVDDETLQLVVDEAMTLRERRAE